MPDPTLIRFDTLPAGVKLVRRYRSLHGALVECHHSPLLRTRTGIATSGYVSSDGDRPFCPVCRTVDPDPDRPVMLLALVPKSVTATPDTLF